MTAMKASSCSSGLVIGGAAIDGPLPVTVFGLSYAARGRCLRMAKQSRRPAINVTYFLVLNASSRVWTIIQLLPDLAI